MDNYKEVLRIEDSLEDDYGEQLTLFERLQIAAQIQTANVIAKGLFVNKHEDPQPLEAIAIALGYSLSRVQSTVATSLDRIADQNEK